MSIQSIERVNVLNIPVDTVTMTDALNYVEYSVEENQLQRYVLAINPEKVMTLRNNEQLLSAFRKASLLIPDGIGVVMAMKLLFQKNIERVAGADLMQNICALAAKKGYGIFIYGSKEEVNRTAAVKLMERYPGIRITGRSHGYVSESDMTNLEREINESGADILFVALGSPMQENWIKTHLPKLNVKICQGIGGTLDTIAGNVKRAPVVFQKVGLEWFYRLLTDPRRIRRQMVLPKFALEVMREKYSG